MTARRRWVSWAAVSTEAQAEKVSIDEQLALNRQHIEKHDGTLLEELVVPGESRNIILFEDAARKIPAYARLKELIDAKAFDVLVFFDRSRLGRKASLSMAVIELCREAKILTYETDNPPYSLDQDVGSDDLILGAIKSVGAQTEVEKMKRRLAMGRAGRAKRGEFSNRVPWGWKERYTEDGTRIVEVDDAAAKVIRLALLDLYLRDGLGLNVIADKLNSMGFASPTGREWSRAALQSMLIRKWRYAGYSEFNRRSKRGGEYIRAPGNFPSIISDDEVRAIDQEQTTRAASRRAVNQPHRFSRIVYCAGCGSRMIVDRKSSDREYFRCRKPEHKPILVRTDLVEIALQATFETLESEDVRNEALGRARNHDDITAGLRAVQTNVESIHKALERADTAFVQGLLDLERYQKQVGRLRDQLAAAQAEETRLKEEMRGREFDAKRGDRIEEVWKLGLRMLGDENTTRVNSWLRRRVRVWATSGKVLSVEII